MDTSLSNHTGIQLKNLLGVSHFEQLSVNVNIKLKVKTEKTCQYVICTRYPVPASSDNSVKGKVLMHRLQFIRIVSAVFLDHTSGREPVSKMEDKR